jgi:lycopene cyclase domain-containing protein
MEPWAYLAMLGFVIVASWWLEWAFKLRVLRDPKRLGLTLLIAVPAFVLWDAVAIAQGHWFFDNSQMTGIIGPFGVPLEEYLFFVIIPIAAVLTWEGVRAFLRLVRRVKTT